MSLHLMSDYNVATEPRADFVAQPDVNAPPASSSASKPYPNAELRRLALDVISVIDAQSDPLQRDSKLVMQSIHNMLKAVEPEEKLLLDAALDVCAPTCPRPHLSRISSHVAFLHPHGRTL
jgi:hypothetical protein